jgi:hypothetical protein
MGSVRRQCGEPQMAINAVRKSRPESFHVWKFSISIFHVADFGTECKKLVTNGALTFA